MMGLPADLVPILLLAVLEALAIFLHLAGMGQVCALPIQTEGAALQLGHVIRPILNRLLPEGLTIREPIRGEFLAPEPLERMGTLADGALLRRRRFPSRGVALISLRACRTLEGQVTSLAALPADLVLGRLSCFAPYSSRSPTSAAGSPFPRP